MSFLACHACGHTTAPLEPRPFRCPNAGDGRDHVLVRKLDRADAQPFFDAEPNPFVRYRRFTHAWQTAMQLGMSDGEFVALVRRHPLFAETPLWQRDDGVWVKDERGNVAGSHKGRHLMGLMLWFEIARLIDPSIAGQRLAIASCGNAALAAATIAQAANWPLDVFVPDWASPDVIARLEALGAHVTRCPRHEHEAGDPAYLRFREAVAAGALPFTCQGSENGLVIEGGQTLGWELVSQLVARGMTPDRLFVQVGGGALASACSAAFEEALALGVIEKLPRFHAVQTRAVAPLQRAWERVTDLDYAIQHRDEFMLPWESPGESIATGILDDETYDWVAVVRGMRASGGWPVVVSEERLCEAMADDAVSATGAAGLAGWMEIRKDVDPEDKVAVLFTSAG